jgi:hypothetical protein
MPLFVADITHEFRRYKKDADKALSVLSDDDFRRRVGDAVNPVGIIVKHLGGNLRSRWTDFLTTDGDKPTRDRDAEFVLTDADTRESLTAVWEAGWSALFTTLAEITDTDLEKLVTIRGEPHRVQQALFRGLGHAAYHVGQIMYLARLMNPTAEYVTIPPGKSKQHVAGYLKPTGGKP